MIIMLVVGHLLAAAAHAADTIDSVAFNAVAPVATTTVLGTTSVEAGTEPVCKPTVSSKLTSKNRRKISAAFDVALDRVREEPGCRDLFANLGSDGMDAMARLVFIPIGRAEARGEACRGISAYTLHGGGPIWICRQFSNLSDEQAAMVIIHEALHHAGLSEYPQDPNGMTSRAINGMVMEQCGL
jgi:hypothetical protein